MQLPTAKRSRNAQEFSKHMKWVRRRIDLRLEQEAPEGTSAPKRPRHQAIARRPAMGSAREEAGSRSWSARSIEGRGGCRRRRASFEPQIARKQDDDAVIPNSTVGRSS